MEKGREWDQCNIGKRAQGYNSELARVKLCLFNEKISCGLLNWLSFRRREILVAKSIRAMNKIGDTKFCTFLFYYKFKREREDLG